MSEHPANKQWITSLVMAAAAFGTYLIMRRYVLSDKIEPEDYMIAGAIGIGLMAGQLFRAKRKK